MVSVKVAIALCMMSFALVLLVAGCGDDKTSEPDTTAPATINDLRVTGAGCDDVALAWTAPGDDGMEGKASSYDLRYFTEAITASNWESATQYQGEPEPKTAGQPESLSVSGLTAGTTYHFALVALDDEGNDSGLSNNASTTVGSTAIGWVNDGLADDEDWSTSTTSLSANWSGSGCVTGYEYAIGTTQGGTEVVGWTPWSSTDITHSGLELADGETYYFSVRGILGGTPGTPKSSDGITVDISLPDSWVEELPEQVTTPGFTVTWTGTDAASGIKCYDIQVSTDGASWTDWLNATTLTSSEFTGANGTTYYFRSRAYDNAGNVEAYQPAPDAHTTVNLSTFIAWVNDGLGDDEDWVRSTTSLSANWAEASYADEYEFAIGTTQGGIDLVGWTSIGTETSVTRGSLTLTDGQTYFASARSVYGGMPGTPTSSDGITVDMTAPTSSVDALAEETQTLVFTVTWSGSDATSGIKHYDVQVSSDGGSSWGSWLTGTELTSGDFTGTNGTTYHFRCRAHDNAGNIEAYPTAADAHTTVNLAAGLQVAYVNDGLGEDLDWTGSPNTLYANWPELSGAGGYDCAVGTTPGSADVTPWGGCGTATSVSLSPLSLNHGQTYYVSVRVTVGTTHGPVVSSDGITVDWNPPSSSVNALEPAVTDIPFTVTWSGSDAVSGVAYYDIQVKDGDGEWQDWLAATELTASDFYGEIDHTYYFRSQAYDRVGNVESYPSQADTYTCLTCTFAYSLRWGQEGSGDGDFSYPFNAAVDATGNVYVVDHSNHRIQVFDSEGNLVDKWGEQGTGDGEFQQPASVAIDDSGYVYVTDWGNARVQKFTADGGFVTKWGRLGTADTEMVYPRGIAVDDSFYVYVAEQGNERIHKFTSNGVSVAIWGELGPGDGQFNGLMSVAVGQSGDIYAVDAYNKRIQQFTSNGVFVRKWGSNGVGDGQFYGPNFVAVDPTGHVYVTDYGECRVQRFTSEGTFLNRWGGCGTGEGEFGEPFGIAVGADGIVYVVDIDSHCVVKFTPTCP
jgi:hypothetical protein